MEINKTFETLKVKNHDLLNCAMFYGIEQNSKGLYVIVCYTNTPHRGLCRMIVTHDKYKTYNGAVRGFNRAVDMGII